MSEIKKILVPIDSSLIAVRAIKEAIKLNKNLAAEIDLLYVADVNKLAINAYLSGNILMEINKTGDRILQESKDLFPKEMTVNTIYKVGDPGELICEYAEEINPDIIIMGSRGLGVVRGMLLGSVSKSVLEHAKCPVLIVK